MNLNCASTVALALKSCEMEGVDRLVQQLSQPTTAPSLDVRGSIATALDEGKDQVQRLMEFSNLGLMYLATIKPGDVSDFIQKYIYAKTRSKIETIIMEGKLLSLNLDGTSITAQDVVGYLSKQFEKLPKEHRSKVRSTRWLFETYFQKFGNYTSDVATGEKVFRLFPNTQKEIEEGINKRREAVLTVAGAGVAGLIAYLLTPEEDRPIVVPTAALLGGVATNSMVKRL